jgi:hypothetical protein
MSKRSKRQMTKNDSVIESARMAAVMWWFDRATPGCQESVVKAAQHLIANGHRWATTEVNQQTKRQESRDGFCVRAT